MNKCIQIMFICTIFLSTKSNIPSILAEISNRTLTTTDLSSVVEICTQHYRLKHQGNRSVKKSIDFNLYAY